MVPDITKEKLKETLKIALQNLKINQPNLSAFTSESVCTEWNLAHHLANEISTIFKDLDCDIELTKSNFSNRRPDIILHKRGTNESNFLIIEMKKNGKSKNINEDLEKIKSNWFRFPLSYHFGVIINYLENSESTVDVLENHIVKN